MYLEFLILACTIYILAPFLLSKTITKLQEVAPSIISYTDKINIQDTNTLRSIFTYMSPKLIKEHFTSKKEYRTYKRSFYFFIWVFQVALSQLY